MFFQQRGQVNSPFELLVAIIIMGFVIIIGSQMIASTNDQVCLAGVEQAMTEFKLKLEDTDSFRTSNQFNFRPVSNNCYNENQSIMTIEFIRGNSRRCGAVCGRAVDSCFVLTYQASDVVNGFKQKCLNLPVYTSFVDGSSCPTQEQALSGYTAINPSAVQEVGPSIPSGNYVLRNVAAAGKTYPEICVYWKR